MRVAFKSCPRCQGDVSSKRDMYGEYTECLQCGYVVDAPTPKLHFTGVIGKLKPGRPKKNAIRQDVLV